MSHGILEIMRGGIQKFETYSVHVLEKSSPSSSIFQGLLEVSYNRKHHVTLMSVQEVVSKGFNEANNTHNKSKCVAFRRNATNSLPSENHSEE